MPVTILVEAMREEQSGTAQKCTARMAELERIKANHAERLRRNLEGVAREKATFGNWLTTKQQEVQNITERLELFTNRPDAGES